VLKGVSTQGEFVWLLMMLKKVVPIREDFIERLGGGGRVFSREITMSSMLLRDGCAIAGKSLCGTVEFERQQHSEDGPNGNGCSHFQFRIQKKITGGVFGGIVDRLGLCHPRRRRR